MPRHGSRAVDSSAVEIKYETDEWRCAPYHHSRLAASPTPLIIVLLVGVNYVPLVLFTCEMGVNAGKVVVLVIFHLLVGLMFLSWLYTCCTDPGTPPDSWQRQMSAAASRGESVQVCRRSGLYKPPRSHFDSVTERLTLNMDHFCPWVVNTVGFYNRKFFMLFLCYANLTMLVAFIFLCSQITDMWPWMQNEDDPRWFPPMVNILLFGGALVTDGVLLFCVVGPFMVFHFGMATRNETTIEGGSNPHYDVGIMQNLRSVFGRHVWAWPLPLYLHGPDGDGLHWPTTGPTAPDYQRRSTPTAPTPSGVTRPAELSASPVPDP